MRKLFRALEACFRGRSRADRRRIALHLERLEDRTVPTIITSTVHALGAGAAIPAAGGGLPAGLNPAQIRHAYGFDRITFNNGAVRGDGGGQTIAIVDAYDQPNIASDLATFDATFGLANPPRFTKVNQSGGATPPAADQGWGLEISLDVEWAHAVAPGANILLVEANSNSGGDLLTALNYARNQPGVSVVSLSWAAAEWSGEASFDSYFATPAGHNGVTFVAASGDNGSAGAAAWPSVSPNVLAVGGTQLSVDAAGNYLGETGWSGSGGGVSVDEAQPGYQKGTVFQSASRRAVPDVAYDAAGASAYAVYDTTDGGWLEAYGTSAGAPQWAGLIAVADQGRALAGKGALDGGTQTLPLLYLLPASDFHDVTSGSNGAYSAATGYDLVTGLGSPLADRVVAGLVGSSQSAGGGQSSPGQFEVLEVPGDGVWRYTAAGWQQLDLSDATLLTTNASGAVVAGFKDYGVWRYTDAAGWKELTPADATLLAEDASGAVVADFKGDGVWSYTAAAGWKQLDQVDAGLLTTGASGSVVGDFGGYGLWRYTDAAGWRQLDQSDAAQLSVASNGDVLAAFKGYGVWRYTDAAGWQQLDQSDAPLLTADASGGLAADFSGYGLWRYTDAAGWKQVNQSDAALLSIAPDGAVLAEFQGYGVWRYTDAVGWSSLSRADVAMLSISNTGSALGQAIGASAETRPAEAPSNPAPPRVDAAYEAARDTALFGDPRAPLTQNPGRAATTPPSAAVPDDPAPPMNGDPAVGGGKRQAPLAETGAGSSTTSDDALGSDGGDPFAVE